MTTSGPAVQPAGQVRLYRFGDVTLDLDGFELLRGGVPQQVEPQVLEVLAYLIRHRDRLVTKQELMDQVWHDRFVSDSAITSRIKAVRRVTGDDGERQNVIRTVHGRGYRFVAALTETVRPPQQTTPATARCLGREDELAALQTFLADAAAGGRRVVLVSGESGIGKTTLVEAFLAGLPPGKRILGVGQCHPVGVGEPYASVLDALADLATGPAADLVRRRLDEMAPAWLLQLPALVDTRHATSLATRTLGSTPERMLREALDLLDVLAASVDGPLVVVLEDLHWADRATGSPRRCYSRPVPTSGLSKGTCGQRWQRRTIAPRWRWSYGRRPICAASSLRLVGPPTRRTSFGRWSTDSPRTGTAQTSKTLSGCFPHETSDTDAPLSLPLAAVRP